MALTLTTAELRAALRLGDGAEETAEVTRLLGYAAAAIAEHLGGAFDATQPAIVNEAAVRLVAYLFDQPNAGRGSAFANAMRNSGAGRILLPHVVHRLGAAEADAAEQAAAGSGANPVTGLAITADGKLEITFADGSTVEQAFLGG